MTDEITASAPTASAAFETLVETGWEHGEQSWSQLARGVVHASEFQARDEEYVLALTNHLAPEVYSKMRNESRLAEVLRAVATPILGSRIVLDPNGARDDIVQFIARDLGVDVLDQEPLEKERTKGRFSLREHLRYALITALTYGHAPFEQVVAMGDDRFYHLRKLALRHPSTLHEIVTARDGGLTGIRQKPPPVLYGVASEGAAHGGLTPEPLIPVEHLVFYAFEKDSPSQWAGRSLLRPAYGPWLRKEEALRVWMTSTRRNGMGQPVFEGAEGMSDDQLKRALTDIAKKVKASDTAGAAIPHGSKLTFQGVTGAIPDHASQVKYFDEEMARVAVMEHVKLGGNSSGSRALGDTFFDAFLLVLQDVQTWLAGVFNEHVIEDLVDWNWGENEKAPRLLFEPVGSDMQLTAEAVQRLVSSGAIGKGVELDKYLRKRWHMPLDDLTKADFADPVPTAPGSDPAAPDTNPAPGNTKGADG